MTRGGKREGAGRSGLEGGSGMLSTRLGSAELVELRELAAKLKITQADVVRMGIAAARKKAANSAEPSVGVCVGKRRKTVAK